MQIAVCDDEQGMRALLVNLVKESISHFNILQKKLLEKSDIENITIQVFSTGKEMLDAINGSDQRLAMHFDIIFLDIQMEGMNGIETAKAIRACDEDAIIIFITALKEYVFEAFDVAAFHYLVKPFHQEKFTEVFFRAIQEGKKRQKKKEEQILVQSGRRSITLTKSSILYVENKAKKLEIHTTTEMIVIYAAMNSLEQELGADFYRCHRGYLVNMAHIAAYDRDNICLVNGECIYLAKERYPAFVKAYMRYLRREVRGSV